MAGPQDMPDFMCDDHYGKRVGRHRAKKVIYTGHPDPRRNIGSAKAIYDGDTATALVGDELPYIPVHSSAHRLERTQYLEYIQIRVGATPRPNEYLGNHYGDAVAAIQRGYLIEYAFYVFFRSCHAAFALEDVEINFQIHFHTAGTIAQVYLRRELLFGIAAALVGGLAFKRRNVAQVAVGVQHIRGCFAIGHGYHVVISPHRCRAEHSLHPVFKDTDGRD